MSKCPSSSVVELEESREATRGEIKLHQRLFIIGLGWIHGNEGEKVNRIDERVNPHRLELVPVEVNAAKVRVKLFFIFSSLKLSLNTCKRPKLTAISCQNAMDGLFGSSNMCDFLDKQRSVRAVLLECVLEFISDEKDLPLLFFSAQ